MNDFFELSDEEQRIIFVKYNDIKNAERLQKGLPIVSHTEDCREDEYIHTYLSGKKVLIRVDIESGEEIKVRDL